jgi:hypothetical protein
MTTVAPTRLASISVWPNANSASRLPRTGNTCVAGSIGMPCRRQSHPAIVSRSAGVPIVVG